jgi:hypothetical protein
MKLKGSLSKLKFSKGKYVLCALSVDCIPCCESRAESILKRIASYGNYDIAKLSCRTSYTLVITVVPPLISVYSIEPSCVIIDV